MIALDDSGWLVPCAQVSHAPSDNCDARAQGCTPELLVIHNISLPPGQFGTGCAIALFQNRLDFDSDPWFENIRGLRVSAHFLIERSGRITQFVSCLARAWHAGVSSFQGRSACNDFSVGIELEGTDTVPYTDEQYQQLADLSNVLRAHYALQAAVGHSDIAPQRKTDPGPAFDWNRFGELAHWPAKRRPPRLVV